MKRSHYRQNNLPDAAILMECLLRFKREHAIVSDHGKAVGTGLVHKRLGARRGARIKYGFLSANRMALNCWCVIPGPVPGHLG